MSRDPELVTASEIASWSWCPESWRLEALGNEPENRAALNRGVRFHAETASVEQSSRSMLALGFILLLAAAVLGVAYLPGALR